jgi:mannose-1-phosphate guanylyltransferase/mannose-6-phosphate isomerase
MIIPVILCGGVGSRLWPASVEARPKPFLPLVGGASTFALTLERIADPSLFAPPLIVANVQQRYLVEAALTEAGVEATLLLEPEPRDTSAAIVAAAVFAEENSPGAVILVLPADHVIRDVDGFRATVAAGLPAAEAGHIVVFGIKPDRPATSFGYIQPGEALPDAAGVAKVAAFAEKPDAATAARYIEAGHFWNGGMFMMRARTAIEEASSHAPAVVGAVGAAVAKAARANSVIALDATEFGAAPKISIDYAVMEKTGRAAVIEARFDWSDLGTWSSVWDAAEKDAAGNAASGSAMLVDSRGSFVHSDRPLIGLVGVKDMIVVASEDAILVAPRERADDVKKLASEIGGRPAGLAGGHVRHHRPWGYYQSLDTGETHQVKRIVVKPGGRLSLQKHARRSEHWTVVSGVAEVTVDETVTLLKENETVFIPRGAVHRMANPGKTPMVLIEVQYGDYLGEDDIIRIADDYGRS